MTVSKVATPKRTSFNLPNTIFYGGKYRPRTLNFLTDYGLLLTGKKWSENSRAKHNDGMVMTFQNTVNTP